MAYLTGGISLWRIDEIDLGLVVTARTSHVDKVIQCYVSGDLVCWQYPDGGMVRFLLRQATPNDLIVLLAVDRGDERTDYWQEAFGTDGVHGNRIEVLFRRDLLDGRRPGDRWRVYRGDAGDGEAATQVYEADVYPGGRGATGWGFDWGYGAWGHSGSNAPGWGTYWGYTWGFGIDYLSYTTPPLGRGTYPIKVEVADAHGNVSTASEAAVVVDTYAQPADDLAVGSYTQGTDMLALTLAPSEDID